MYIIILKTYFSVVLSLLTDQWSLDHELRNIALYIDKEIFPMLASLRWCVTPQDVTLQVSSSHIVYTWCLDLSLCWLSRVTYFHDRILILY